MSKQYTIRDISPQLDAKIRAKAARERISLNKAVLKVLDEGLQKTGSNKKSHHDFDDLSGSWQKDPDFDAAMQDSRRVDEKDWQ